MIKNCETTFALLRCRLLNVYEFFIIALLTAVVACQPEKEQRAGATAADSVNIESHRKASDTVTRRPVFPGGDVIQQGCMFVQGNAETLLEEYYRPATTKERKKQITAELEQLDLEWKEMDCRQVFGFMIPEIPGSAGRSKEN